MKMNTLNGWTERELALLRAEWGRATVKELARHLGRGVSTVAKKAAELGLTIVKPSREQRREAIAALFAQGCSDEQIGRELGLTAKSVKNYRNRFGLKRNGETGWKRLSRQGLFRTAKGRSA